MIFSLKQLLLLFKSWWNPITENNNRLRLYHAALSFIGTDVTPKDEVPDEVACAETVWTLLSLVDPNAFGIQKTASSYYLYTQLKESKNFTQVTEPLEGDLVASPTGLFAYKSKIKSGSCKIKKAVAIVITVPSFTLILKKTMLKTAKTINEREVASFWLLTRIKIKRPKIYLFTPVFAAL